MKSVSNHIFVGDVLILRCSKWVVGKILLLIEGPEMLGDRLIFISYGHVGSSEIVLVTNRSLSVL